MSADEMATGQNFVENQRIYSPINLSMPINEFDIPRNDRRLILDEHVPVCCFDDGSISRRSERIEAEMPFYGVPLTPNLLSSRANNHFLFYGSRWDELTYVEKMYFQLGIDIINIAIVDMCFGNAHRNTFVENFFRDISDKGYAQGDDYNTIQSMFSLVMNRLNTLDIELELSRYWQNLETFPLMKTPMSHPASTNFKNLIEILNYRRISEALSEEKCINLATQLYAIALEVSALVKKEILLRSLNDYVSRVYSMNKIVLEFYLISEYYTFDDVKNTLLGKNRSTYNKRSLSIRSGKYFVSALTLSFMGKEVNEDWSWDDVSENLLCGLYTTPRNYGYLKTMKAIDSNPFDPSMFSFYYNEEDYSDQTRGVKRLMRMAKDYAESLGIPFISEKPELKFQLPNNREIYNKMVENFESEIESLTPTSGS